MTTEETSTTAGPPQLGQATDWEALGRQLGEAGAQMAKWAEQMRVNGLMNAALHAALTGDDTTVRTALDALDTEHLVELITAAMRLSKAGADLYTERPMPEEQPAP